MLVPVGVFPAPSFRLGGFGVLPGPDSRVALLGAASTVSDGLELFPAPETNFGDLWFGWGFSAFPGAVPLVMRGGLLELLPASSTRNDLQRDPESGVVTLPPISPWGPSPFRSDLVVVVLSTLVRAVFSLSGGLERLIATRTYSTVHSESVALKCVRFRREPSNVCAHSTRRGPRPSGPGRGRPPGSRRPVVGHTARSGPR